MKFHQFLLREHILERLEWDPMGNLGKAVQSLPSHSLGGRVRCDILRIGLFQFLQLAKHPVVLKVGDGGLIQHIVLVIVVIELLPELLNLLQGIHIHCAPLRY